MEITLRILETPEEINAVEDLQRQVWPGSEADIVPMHLMITVAHTGGLVMGAFDGTRLVGLIFGFPGVSIGPDGPRLKHCSHMLGVLPEYRDRGVGFALKRAQWQMVRHQGVELISWTYDPVISRNANLNIAKLGGVCSTYMRDVYGEMRDELNIGLPSDRFQVDLWVNSPRVSHRMGRRPRRRLDLAHYYQAGAELLNPTSIGEDHLPAPPPDPSVLPIPAEDQESNLLLLVEIPADFLSLKRANPELALAWRLHTRSLFEGLFARGYLVTDFVYLPGTQPRSFYVLSHGESTLGA